MKILGLNYFYHDSTACLVVDGKLVVAIEEERLNRVKHTNAFPYRSIKRCLEVAGLEPGDIEPWRYRSNQACTGDQSWLMH